MSSFSALTDRMGDGFMGSPQDSAKAGWSRAEKLTAVAVLIAALTLAYTVWAAQNRQTSTPVFVADPEGRPRADVILIGPGETRLVEVRPNRETGIALVPTSWLGKNINVHDAKIRQLLTEMSLPPTTEGILTITIPYERERDVSK